ncbi:MAG: response regulator [Bdellovibrionales bacterium]
MPKSRKVLVVDDDLYILEVYSELLSQFYTPIVAQTEGEALAILKTQEVDAVLCDISLGGGSGIKRLEHLRSLKIHVPFVLTSGDVKKEHLISALRLGAQDVVEKPIDIKYFQTKLRDLTNEGFSLRKINSSVKQVKALVGNTSSDDDLKFVKEYLATVEANRLLKKIS